MSVPVRETPRTRETAAGNGVPAAHRSTHAAAHAVDRLQRWKAPRVLAGFAVLFGLLFVALSTMVPVWHTDIWGHLAYGRFLWQHGRLPATEPLMPLARGVPFVDTVWLSQLSAYVLYSQFGVAALRFLYAASITAACAVLAYAAYRSTRSAWCAFIGVATFGWVNYQPLLIVRPQLAGLLCFVVLLTWLVSGRRRRWHLWAVPMLFAVWTNLHGSFPTGLLLLALFALGRAIDVVWRTGRPRTVFSDASIRRLPLLLALGAAAVLANPYGPGIYAEVLAVARNPNLRDLVEWKPLTLRMLHGQAAAAVTVALFIAYRFSRRRVRAAEILLLAGFGLLALWHSRMLLWWGSVAAYYLPLHVSGAWRGRTPLFADSSPRSGRWTIATAAAALAGFFVTPFGTALIHGPPAEEAAAAQQLRQSVSRLTPVDAVAWLNEHPPRGQVFNTYEWGDYLLWAGPPDLPVFVASHAHLVPRNVWMDYMRVSETFTGWEAALDRYGVNTVIVDRRVRAALVTLLRQDGNWHVDYEDPIAVIFVRRQPN